MISLIQETSGVTPEPFTWKGIIAIGTGLIFIGFLMDFFLLKSGNDKILKIVGRWEIQLAYMPIRKMQVDIAKFVLSLKALMNPVDNKLLYFLKEKRLDKAFRLVYSFVGILFVALILSIYYNFVEFSQANEYAIASFCSLFICWSGAFVYKNLPPAYYPKYFKIMVNNTYVRYGPLFTTVCLSVLFTSIAFIISQFFVTTPVDFFWYTIDKNMIIYKNTTILLTTNYVFDFLTIIISLKLISWIAHREYKIELVALLDIIISALLTILLHACLKTIESGNISAILIQVIDSTNFFIKIITLNISNVNQYYPMIPILLTTFIPVVFYMGIFIVLGLIVKPITRFTGYVCKLIFEKEKSPFFQLSLILSFLITFIKALSQWEWFVYILKN